MLDCGASTPIGDRHFQNVGPLRGDGVSGVSPLVFTCCVKSESGSLPPVIAQQRPVSGSQAGPGVASQPLGLHCGPANTLSTTAPGRAEPSSV
ncbi:unnamed protein product [Boreogadus saida]